MLEKAIKRGKKGKKRYRYYNICTESATLLDKYKEEFRIVSLEITTD